MSEHSKRPVIIWTPAETVYQETVDGKLSLSSPGWAMDLEELRRFCAAHDMDFVIYRPEAAK